MSSSLRRRVAAPLVAGLTVLVATSGWLLHRARQSALESQRSADVTAMDAFVRSKLSTEAYLLEAVLRTLAVNERLQGPFRARDRDALLAEATPLFEELRENHRITHLYFSDAERINVLRVHRPEQFGDTIPRGTTLEAQRTGRVARGVEVGRLRGLTTLRVVLPWEVDGQVLGYLELGQEVDRFGDEASEILGVGAVVFIDKEGVDREAWEAGMRMFGREPRWEGFGSRLLVSRSGPDIPAATLSAYLASDDRAREVRVGGRSYFGGIVPLRWADDPPVGEILFLRDRTDAVREARLAALLALAACAVVGLVVATLILRLVRTYLHEPLQELRSVAGAVGQGDLSRQVRVRRSDELGELGIAVNRMIQDLHASKNAWERQVVSAALDAVVTLDAHGMVVGWGGHAVEILGWTEEEALGRPLTEVVLAPDSGGPFVRVMRGEDPDGAGRILGRHSDVTGLRKGGVHFAAEVGFSPVSHASGPRYVMFVRDVTEQRRAATALRESESRLRMLVETAGVHPWIAEAGGGVHTYVGPQVEALLGYAAEDWVVPGFLAGVVHPDDVEGHRAMLATAETDGSATTEYRLLHRDGSTVWVRDLVRHDVAPDGSHWLHGFRIDLTERRQLEGQLARAQKMEAVGRLAGGVAHDFNNIMTAILGYALLLEEDLDEGDPRRTDVSEIVRAGSRAAELTQQLLAFARKQVVQPRAVDVPEALRGVERMLRRLLREDISLQMHLPERAPPIWMDPGQFEQILVNLVVNARDAMPTGGAVTIEVGEASVQRRDQLDTEFDPGRYLALVVSDTGTGMSEDTLARIFEPFFTTKPVGKGTGLGLATCLGIVRQAGGDIRAYSELGLGTTFRVYLPMKHDAVVEHHGTPEDEDLGGHERILLVEDEEQVSEVAARVLREAGYDVCVAADGAEAVRIARELDHIDLLFTDLVMPRMGGQEAADIIVRDHPDISLLFTTGYSERHLSHTGEPTLPGLFMEKPFTPRMLLETVRDALDGDGGSRTRTRTGVLGSFS
ncbi:MAG: PAS domain S-box protein [Longimicrobiales bacterium]